MVTATALVRLPQRYTTYARLPPSLPSCYLRVPGGLICISRRSEKKTRDVAAPMCNAFRYSFSRSRIPS
jgi:hypothetical protein